MIPMEFNKWSPSYNWCDAISCGTLYSVKLVRGVRAKDLLLFCFCFCHFFLYQFFKYFKWITRREAESPRSPRWWPARSRQKRRQFQSQSQFQFQFPNPIRIPIRTRIRFPIRIRMRIQIQIRLRIRMLLEIPMSQAYRQLFISDVISSCCCCCCCVAAVVDAGAGSCCKLKTDSSPTATATAL